MKMLSKLPLRIVAVIASISAACGHRVMDATARDHVWYRPVPQDVRTVATRVAEAFISPVLESKISEASAMLGDVPAVELADAAFEDLVGGGTHANGPRVLLRGLCGGCYTGTFMCTRRWTQ